MDRERGPCVAEHGGNSVLEGRSPAQPAACGAKGAPHPGRDRGEHLGLCCADTGDGDRDTVAMGAHDDQMDAAVGRALGARQGSARPGTPWRGAGAGQRGHSDASPGGEDDGADLALHGSRR